MLQNLVLSCLLITIYFVSDNLAGKASSFRIIDFDFNEPSTSKTDYKTMNKEMSGLLHGLGHGQHQHQHQQQDKKEKENIDHHGGGHSKKYHIRYTHETPEMEKSTEWNRKGHNKNGKVWSTGGGHDSGTYGGDSGKWREKGNTASGDHGNNGNSWSEHHSNRWGDKNEDEHGDDHDHDDHHSKDHDDDSIHKNDHHGQQSHRHQRYHRHHPLHSDHSDHF